MRPNIRVEIHNNLAEEAMEVDENEEGEISDQESNETTEKPEKNDANDTKSSNSFDTFVIGKKDEEKLQERAKRFSLKPQEIKNFKEEDLRLLHSSLGITPTNDSNVRFEVIHMRGIEQMNAGDILDYFLEYAPSYLEWIDEMCCNIVWSDKISSARALHFMSKSVRGMPVRDDTSYFDNLQESEEVDQSVLMLNRNREIQLQEETEENVLLNEDNSVDISEITAIIPPGYWRLGKKHAKAKCILMRFSLKTDKKPYKVETFNRYYKNFGKKEFKQEGIFGRNKDMRKMNEENPWTVLAKNWDEDAQFREKDRSEEKPKLEIKSTTLRNRLGAKRKEEEVEESDNTFVKKKIKIPRMRMYADEEEEKIRRKKMLQKINKQIQKIDQDTSTNSDLRTILNMTNRTHGVKIEKSEPEVFDLGSRLKNRNKKMVFQIKTEVDDEARYVKQRKERDFRPRRRYSEEEDFEKEEYSDKPKSKVAVVIKTHKKPTVASAVNSTGWSRFSRSESESESDENITEESSNETEEVQTRNIVDRPGFSRSSEQNVFKSPLKIEISNDHFKK